VFDADGTNQYPYLTITGAMEIRTGEYNMAAPGQGWIGQAAWVLSRVKEL
jgi:hypothetical protein